MPEGIVKRPELAPQQRVGIRFLVESALRKVASSKSQPHPATSEAWLDHLCEALVDGDEEAHERVLANMVANGIPTNDIMDKFLPEAARRLGEWWVLDRASFVDVTLGAGRLQTVYRRHQADRDRRLRDRTIPLGQSILMVIPAFEQHSIGAFVAADQFRRHGLWVHMGIALENEELVELVNSDRFAMIGMTSASTNTLERLAEMVDHLRSNVVGCPPIVVGGQVVGSSRGVSARVGADFAVRTAREAIELCGLSSVSESLSSEIRD